MAIEYISDPQNYKEVLYFCAVLTLIPIFWDLFYTPFWGSRTKAIKRGAELIYSHQDTLTISEIAEKWICSDVTQPVDHIIEWFISDLWMGSFENQCGKTDLVLRVKINRQPPPDIPATRLYLLNSCFAFLTDEQQKASNPHSISLPVDENLPQAKRNKLLGLIDWQYLSSLRISDYKDSAAVKMYGGADRRCLTAYIKYIFIPKQNFIKWLKKCSQPLPGKWYDKT